MSRSRITAISITLTLVFSFIPELKASANPLDAAKAALAQAERDLNAAKAALSCGGSRVQQCGRQCATASGSAGPG